MNTAAKSRLGPDQPDTFITMADIGHTMHQAWNLTAPHRLRILYQSEYKIFAKIGNGGKYRLYLKIDVVSMEVILLLNG